jgi:hypothetical protein
MMPDESAWDRWGRYAAAAVLAGVVAWFAFVAHREVPVLDWFDLAVHEVGHMVMFFAPRMMMFLGGSVAQVAVPLALAWYFGLVRRDLAGGGFCLAWAGASAWDVSVYIADAPVQALPLIGGEHEIAGFVEFTGVLVAVAGIGIALSAAVSGLGKPVPVLQGISPTEDRPVASESDPWITAADLPFRHEQAG